jgi:ribosome-binding protein aMBF1 (putative translation factor)
MIDGFMARSSTPTTAIQKRGHARARNLRRDVVAAILHATDDAGISRRALCAAAGIGRNTLAALERDDRQPTLEVL